MIEHTRKWVDKRSNYQFEIDGVVFKIDDLQQRENLGMTAHHPAFDMARATGARRTSGAS